VGSSAYYSVRFAPAALRHDLAALLAWRFELRAILKDVTDPGVARLKLQWWREELARTYRGEPRHPMSRILAPALERHRLPREPFLQIADQVEAEILRRHPEDEAALRDACERDQGALFELMARCHGLGDGDDELLASSRRLGVFCARVYLIRDIGALVRRGQIPFPTQSLRTRGLSIERLAQRGQRNQLRELLPEAADQARAELPRLGKRTSLPAVIRVRAAILEALLDALERTDFDLIDQRVALTPLRKLWLGWRESWRG
jgi:phytoene synthase